MPTSPRPNPSEARVLDAAALGDHLDRLLRAALALTGSRPDAEDLVQEVCVRVLAKPRMVRGSEIGYLHGVLRNTYFSDYQQRARRRTVPVEPETLSFVAADSRYDPETATLAREVHRAIADLPPHYRDVVLAVDVVGMAYSEAGAHLGVPDGTIMSRLYRGRAAVAAAVGEPVAA
jgi:RNA polymerase sigma-70 factor (ECF subfamily)